MRAWNAEASGLDIPRDAANRYSLLVVPAHYAAGHARILAANQHIVADFAIRAP